MLCTNWLSLCKYEKISIKLVDGQEFILHKGEALNISGDMVILRTFDGECIWPSTQVLRIDVTYKKGV